MKKYIDAEALKLKFAVESAEASARDANNVVFVAMCKAINDVAEKTIDEMPAADVVEKQGEGTTSKTVKFLLNGCDISFVAEAPEDITTMQRIIWRNNMTTEEAHGYLEDLQREFTKNRHAYADELIEANGQAILALERQIPKKPKPVRGDLAFLCPRCGIDIGYIDALAYEMPKYCPECGQAIDRSVVPGYLLKG